MLPLNIKQINQLTINTFLNLAEEYHRDFQDCLNKNPFDQYLLDQISDDTPDDCLICDAGCGPSAQVGRYLSSKGNRVIAADISPRSIEFARENVLLEDYVVTDMRSSSFKDKSFDAIIARHSIVHTPKSSSYQFFREMSALLKVGGRLLIIVPKGKEEGLITGDWWDENTIYYAQFMESDLKQYAAEYNLSIDLLETKKSSILNQSVDTIYLLCTKKSV